MTPDARSCAPDHARPAGCRDRPRSARARGTRRPASMLRPRGPRAFCRLGGAGGIAFLFFQPIDITERALVEQRRDLLSRDTVSLQLLPQPRQQLVNCSIQPLLV